MGKITTSIATEKTGKRKTSLLQPVLILVILAIVAVSFGINVLSSGAPQGVPGTLADMKLGDFTEGAQALAQVNQLHGTTIDLKDAYIAVYSHDFNPYHNDKARVTVWVGTARSNDSAAGLLKRMVAGISNGGTPFSKPKRLTVGGYEIYQVTGLGGDHFFYQSPNNGQRVIWLTVEEAGNTISIVEQALDEF